MQRYLQELIHKFIRSLALIEKLDQTIIHHHIKQPVDLAFSDDRCDIGYYWEGDHKSSGIHVIDIEEIQNPVYVANIKVNGIMIHHVLEMTFLMKYTNQHGECEMKRVYGNESSSKVDQEW